MSVLEYIYIEPVDLKMYLNDGDILAWILLNVSGIDYFNNFVKKNIIHKYFCSLKYILRAFINIKHIWNLQRAHILLSFDAIISEW